MCNESLHYLPRVPSCRLQDLRPTDLDALYASLLRSGLSMTSVHHVHAVVSKLLHDGERKGLVAAASPAWRTPRPVPPPEPEARG